MPMKKVGSEKVVREVVTQKLSVEDPLRRETSIPRRIPIIIEITVEVPKRTSVFTSRPVVISSVVTA